MKNDWPATGLGKILSLIDWLWDRQLETSVQKDQDDPVMEVARGLQRLRHYLRPKRRDLSWGLRGTGATALKAAVAGKPGAGPAKGSKAGMGWRDYQSHLQLLVFYFFFFCPTNANVTQDSVLGWKLTKVKALWVSNNRESLQLAWAERFIGRMQLPHRTQRAVTESHT